MDKKIKLYGASWCTNCKLTKAVLDSKGVEYKFIDVDTSDDPMIAELGEIPVAVFYKNDKLESKWTQQDGEISSWLSFINW